MLLSLSVGYAELPPSVYEAKQTAATEQLKIQVLRVTIEPGENADTQKVDVLAKVDEVTRSTSGIKVNDMISILYTVTHHPAKWVGPGEVPLLQEGQSSMAYLNSIPDSKNFAPGAGRMSFSKF